MLNLLNRKGMWSIQMTLVLCSVGGRAPIQQETSPSGAFHLGLPIICMVLLPLPVPVNLQPSSQYLGYVSAVLSLWGAYIILCKAGRNGQVQCGFLRAGDFEVTYVLEVKSPMGATTVVPTSWVHVFHSWGCHTYFLLNSLLCSF